MKRLIQKVPFCNENLIPTLSSLVCIDTGNTSQYLKGSIYNQGYLVVQYQIEFKEVED